MKRTAAHCEPDSATVKATRDSFREFCMSDDLVPQEPSKTRVSVSRWLTRRRRSSCSAVVPLHSRIYSWAPLVRNGVPFALVKSPLDLDGLRDEATGICRSKLRTCPSRCTIRQPSGCRNAGIDSLSGSANLQGVRARARTAASSSVSLMAIASGILATTCGERLVGRTLSEAPAASREAVSGPGSIGVPIIGLATPGSLVWPSGRKIDGCHWSHGGAGTPVR